MSALHVIDAGIAPPVYGGSRSAQLIGASGVVLALLVLAASVWLRLHTVVGPDGSVTSTLAPAAEQAARGLHRLAAMGVSALALCALVIALRAGRLARAYRAPAAAILGLTLLLSILGPLTPGYRWTAVTVGNVAGGVLLALAFQWWARRARSPLDADRAMPMKRATLTFAAYVAQVALGAAASAQWLRGEATWLLPHILVALGFVTAAVSWRLALRGRAARHALDGVLLLVAAQVGLGIALAISAPAPVGLSLLHALLSPAIGLALVETLLLPGGGSSPQDAA